MATTITATFTLTDQQLADGWGNDPREAALSVVARLDMVIGDDGNDYPLADVTVQAVQDGVLHPMIAVTLNDL